MQHQGRWHLHGIDQEAGGSRTFLLSRIVGPVKVTARTFDPEQYRVDGEAFAERALAELERIWERNVAEIEVTAGHGCGDPARQALGDASRRREGNRSRLTVNFSDRNILADELASFGPEVARARAAGAARAGRAAPRGGRRRARRHADARGGGDPMAERRKPMQAQDKLAFLLALVPYLMDRDRVSVAEAAEHFGVEQEQLRDAVRLIAVSGVPGETNAYQHGDLFDIAWDDFEENDEIVLTHQVAIDDSPRFSAREAAALIAGLQYLSALPENADRDAIGSLMAKLARGASAAPSQLAVARSETDEVARDHPRRGRSAACRSSSTTSARAASASARRVDPLRIESVDQDWYLRGWDHLRAAIRTFRLDRIDDLRRDRGADHLPAGRRDAPRDAVRPAPTTISWSTVEVSASAIRLHRRLHPRGRRARGRAGASSARASGSRTSTASSGWSRACPACSRCSTRPRRVRSSPAGRAPAPSGTPAAPDVQR